MTVIELIERLKREDSLATVNVVRYENGICHLRRDLKEVITMNFIESDKRVDLIMDNNERLY